MVFGLLGTGIAVNVSFLVLALRYPSSSIETLPYERGLRHQSVIDARSAFSEAGWRLSAHFGDLDSKTQLRRVDVVVVSSDGERVKGLEIRLSAVRPADEALDVENAFADREGRGEHSALVGLPAGSWLLKWMITQGDRMYLKEESLLLP
jgi:nitrogen fixation protein FixH